jgi:hypothetical protein
MMLINVILSLIILQITSFSGIYDIRSLNVNKKQFILVVFEESTNCTNCISRNISITNESYITENSKYIEIVAAIRCDRDLELKAFKQKYSWKNQVIRDDGHLREKLHLGKDKSFFIFNRSGELVCQYSNTQSESFVKHLKKLIEEHKNSK